MTLETLAFGVNAVSSIVVLWTSICALNHMTRATAWTIRAAHVLLGVGSAAVLLAPGWCGRVPTIAEVTLVSGLAVLAVADQRRRVTRRLLNRL